MSIATQLHEPEERIGHLHAGEEIAPSIEHRNGDVAARRRTSDIQDDDDEPTPKRKKIRSSTSHLKIVPETLDLRETLKARTIVYAETLDRSKPFNRAQLEVWARVLMNDMGLPEKYLGFTAVMIGNAIWRRQFLATPFERRMLLLPHCLKHAEGCPAEYTQFGLDCERCGACSIADYKVKAEQLGYKVLVAEGSPIVLKIIVGGYVDAILGVACLNVLEKAIDKVLIAGVPSYAVPLHSGDCHNTSLDESWIWEVIDKYEPMPNPRVTGYVSIMRSANRLFDENFERLLPRARSKTPETAASPLGKTEDVSYDWLKSGGRRFRPFITLAAYDAATGGSRLKNFESSDQQFEFSDAVARVAMSIEAFHKASLVHDDIEDDDLFRYGRETLHRSEGLGPAINIGDHLIGLGYKLIAASRKELGGDAAGDVLERMAAAHIKLCDGQGAEMYWQSKPTLDFTPVDALQIYALKTSPAFEAALYSGLRMAGSVEKYEQMIPQFCRHLGIGFQILNDLKDWRGDSDNKLVAGQDALALRPTVMMALAWQAANAEQRQLMERCFFDREEEDSIRFNRVRRLFEDLGVFEKAERLIEKSRDRAELLADDLESDEIRQLLYFLVDTVLSDEEDKDPRGSMPKPSSVLVQLPVTTA
ncbi:MAG: polyprenyl synthetase family protein [Planctomycetia bacterium]|nr:polyprenyl synthetase family protein [Planctomycetia bacterium]